jgi:hypothetical protein
MNRLVHQGVTASECLREDLLEGNISVSKECFPKSRRSGKTIACEREFLKVHGIPPHSATLQLKHKRLDCALFLSLDADHLELEILLNLVFWRVEERRRIVLVI